jgi:hypothetical protein
LHDDVGAVVGSSAMMNRAGRWWRRYGDPLAHAARELVRVGGEDSGLAVQPLEMRLDDAEDFPLRRLDMAKGEVADDSRTRRTGFRTFIVPCMMEPRCFSGRPRAPLAQPKMSWSRKAKRAVPPRTLSGGRLAPATS